MCVTAASPGEWRVAAGGVGGAVCTVGNTIIAGNTAQPGQPGSPVIDAGDNALLFHPDFVGGACFDARLSCCPRVRGAAVDIGAIEVQEGEIGLTCTGTHSADYAPRNWRIEIVELLRVTRSSITRRGQARLTRRLARLCQSLFSA